MGLSLALNLLAVLWHTVSGSFRALTGSLLSGFKTPELSDSDVCLVTGAGQVGAVCIATSQRKYGCYKTL